jgi:D-alanyl-D-alanine-carboxypeptidase/D-alanyl-D-alanine-endopeptidase
LWEQGECLMTAEAAKAAAWNVPSDADIRAILRERIDVERCGVGIVVGVIDRLGRRIIAHGAPSAGGGRPLDGDTVFEIGSITKVFTALALAEMVERGEVALDDPVVQYLPPGVTMPERGGKQITLAHLATHTSGLPREPGNLSSGDQSNARADYSVIKLHEFLSAYELSRDIGVSHIYSNLGGGLLGHVLALRAGVDYGTLMRERITGPLGMTSTCIVPTPELQLRMAIGHDEILRPVANIDLPALAGAGALRSTANDLLAFLAAELGADTPLRAAMSAQLGVRQATDTQDIQSLGWIISPTSAGEVVWHTGLTTGFRGFIGFDRERLAGVLVLTNTASTRNDDIGLHLLSGAPLRPPPIKRKAIRLSAAALERYVGRYEFSPTADLVVIRRDGRLFAKLPGRRAIEMFPESPTAFFLKIWDSQLTFNVDPDGEVTGLVTHQNGRNRPAARVA